MEVDFMMLLSNGWLVLASLIAAVPVDTVSCMNLYIDERIGSDTYNCSDIEKPCHSLQYIAQLSAAKTNVSILITSPFIVLKTSVEFKEVINITLRGYNDDASIMCRAAMDSGLIFNKSSNITLQHITMANCGQKASIHVTNDFEFFAMMIYGATNVAIQNTRFSGNIGISLLMINTNGKVTISESEFVHSRIKNCSNTGGLTVIHNSHYQIDHELFGGTNNSFYIVANTTFYNNSYLSKPDTCKKDDYVIKGGGLQLLLFSGAASNIVVIYNCNFTKNFANNGGGMFLQAEGKSVNNRVIVSECTFYGNKIYHGGGAGVDAGVNTYNSSIPINNSFVFLLCNFTDNIALNYGGGLAFFSSYGCIHFGNSAGNSLEINICTFIGNKANGGAAVDLNRIAPTGSDKDNCRYVYVVITKFHFINCKFINNSAGQSTKMSYGSYTMQSGVFFTHEIDVHFAGTNTFTGNTNTALYSTSAVIEFEKEAIMEFTRNTGAYGGAILLVGDAQLILHHLNNVTFEQNSALYGGALCVIPLQTHFLYFTDTCFIKCNRCQDIRITFDSNKASTDTARDIFISTLRPCFEYSIPQNLTEVLYHFSKVCGTKFEINYTNDSSSIATATRALQSTQHHLLLFPGIPYQIKVDQTDEFGHKIELYPLSAQLHVHTSKQMKLRTSSATLTNNTIIVTGERHSTGTLVIETTSLSSVRLDINVSLVDCPAGHYYSNDTCHCAGPHEGYPGIIYCLANYSANLIMGYWAGYRHHAFTTGVCAASLCYNSNQSTLYGHHALPLTSNETELEKHVCASNRRGILCGKCTAGYSTLYHSPSYTCSNASCHYGIPLYILSELLPVTVIFLVILFLDIRLTSGALYTFLFYAQFLHTIYINAFRVIHIKEPSLSYAVAIYKDLYGIFSFEFFTSESFSFCIWPHATAMHIFMIKYATTLYALLLIIFTVAILKVNSLYTCIKLCHQLGRRDIRGSIINALSAFLLLCYSQCVHTTFSILTKVTLHPRNGSEYSYVPIFNGELEYLKGDHLYFAVPAFLCLFVIILPPPLILLTEPLLIKISNILPRRVAYYLLQVRMKMKPFLDSFQGCFKDNCRIFAGFFFVYRVLVFLPTVYTASITVVYMTAEGLLFLWLLCHCFVQPFQKKWHNQLDIFLLMNLLAVNTLTISNYLSMQYISFQDIIISMQLFFITLPLIYISGYVGCFGIRVVKEKMASWSSRWFTKNDEVEDDIEESLPARLLCENLHYDSI